MYLRESKTNLAQLCQDRIRRDILHKKRAEYGAEIVATRSRQLEKEFGCGYGKRNRATHAGGSFPAVRG
jgi:hypothetical protein